MISRRPAPRAALGALAVTGLLAAALAGCAAELADAKGPAAEAPALAGKADFADRVSIRGEVGFDEAVTGRFEEDLEYHGYTFLVSEGAAVSLEVTQRGTSRGLDTTLYLYGPRRSGRYAERLAFDDDDGWGKLSKISGVTLEEGGAYLAVVGTYSGLGRGDYQLELRCDGEDCLHVDPGVLGTCPEEIQQDIRDCVEEWVAEGDYENSPHEGFGACMTDFVGDFFDWRCASASSSPPAWCPAGREAYMERIVPACGEMMAPEFPEPRPPLDLAWRPLSDEIETRLDGANDGCEWSCGVQAAAYVYTALESAEVDLPWIVETVRQAQDAPYRYHGGGAGSHASLASFVDSYDLGADFLRLVETLAGAETYELGHLGANWYVAAGAEAWSDLFVLHFDNGFVFTITFEAGED